MLSFEEYQAKYRKPLPSPNDCLQRATSTLRNAHDPKQLLKATAVDGLIALHNSLTDSKKRQELAEMIAALDQI